jgi:hypothetical protein
MCVRTAGVASALFMVIMVSACKQPTPSASSVMPSEPPERASQGAPQQVAPPASPGPAPEVASREYAMGEWTLVEATSGAKLELIHKGHTQSRVLHDAAADRAHCIKMVIADGVTDPREPDDFESHGEARVLSVTRTMATYTLARSGYCGGAHPSHSYNYYAVSTHSEQPLALTALATQSDIMKALDAHPLVKRAREDASLCLRAPEAANLSNFAIKRIDHGDVEVVIGLPYAAEVCRDTEFESITLTLPVRSIEVRKELQAAQDAGLLMDQLAP